jgi:hypothetical protein
MGEGERFVNVELLLHASANKKQERRRIERQRSAIDRDEAYSSVAIIARFKASKAASAIYSLPQQIRRFHGHGLRALTINYTMMMELFLAPNLVSAQPFAVDRVSGLPVVDTGAGDSAAVAGFEDLAPFIYGCALPYTGRKLNNGGFTYDQRRPLANSSLGCDPRARRWESRAIIIHLNHMALVKG